MSEHSAEIAHGVRVVRDGPRQAPPLLLVHGSGGSGGSGGPWGPVVPALDRVQLGITPKRAARLVRFDHAAHLLAAGHAAGAATGSGYADQSHLHREVKAFTGLTPTGLATGQVVRPCGSGAGNLP